MTCVLGSCALLQEKHWIINIHWHTIATWFAKMLALKLLVNVYTFQSLIRLLLAYTIKQLILACRKH